MNEHVVHILLIDDDEDAQLLTRAALTAPAADGRRFVVDACLTYEEGIEAIRRNAHDVVLLDYRLGARDGLELLREAIASGCRTPIIMLTGQASAEIDRMALEAGAADFLDKNTISAPLLARAIRYTLQRQRASEELREYAARLEEVNNELQQFAYVASHDLQEPLRMVSSYLQLIEKRYGDALDDDAREFIGFAVDGARRMKRLIDDLLDYSRIGTRGESPHPTDAGAVLDEVMADLSVAIRETGATIVRDGPLPTVTFDSTQLRRLLLNLIGNAIKFHGEAPPHVHVSINDEGAHYLGSVRDNGIGIDPGSHQRIFVIFQRLHAKDKYPGTGIGLSVCRKIVERHGGRIWVESQPDCGSTFFFTIPKMKGRQNPGDPGLGAPSETNDYERCAA